MDKEAWHAAVHGFQKVRHNWAMNWIEMFFWDSFAFSMIQWMLAIWSLVPLPFLKPAWTFESSRFMHCWSLAWRILSITLLACEMNAIEPCLTQWNQAMPVGQPKTGGSWWRGLTECGPLEKGMANHFSILALRTAWTVWKGKMIGYQKRNSPGH